MRLSIAVFHFLSCISESEKTSLRYTPPTRLKALCARSIFLCASAFLCAARDRLYTEGVTPIMRLKLLEK